MGEFKPNIQHDYDWVWYLRGHRSRVSGNFYPEIPLGGVFLKDHGYVVKKSLMDIWSCLPKKPSDCLICPRENGCPAKAKVEEG